MRETGRAAKVSLCFYVILALIVGSLCVCLSDSFGPSAVDATTRLGAAGASRRGTADAVEPPSSSQLRFPESTWAVTGGARYFCSS